MACTITLADLGPSFEDVDPAIFDLWLIAATEIVLGPVECQSATEAAWRRCCVDPCRAVTFMTQHLLSTDPNSGGGDAAVVSEKVGDVSATYANATSSAGVYAGSSYGLMFSGMLGKFELCDGVRRTMPRAYGGSRGCGCL